MDVRTTKAEEGLPTSDFQLPISDFLFPTSDLTPLSSSIAARSAMRVLTAVVLVKATKHKSNQATDEVRLGKRNHGFT